MDRSLKELMQRREPLDIEDWPKSNATTCSDAPEYNHEKFLEGCKKLNEFVKERDSKPQLEFISMNKETFNELIKMSTNVESKGNALGLTMPGYGIRVEVDEGVESFYMKEHYNNGETKITYIGKEKQ